MKKLIILLTIIMVMVASVGCTSTTKVSSKTIEKSSQLIEISEINSK
jgi:uncharacterized protein (UPF0333 family)